MLIKNSCNASKVSIFFSSQVKSQLNSFPPQSENIRHSSATVKNLTPMYSLMKRPYYSDLPKINNSRKISGVCIF